MNKAGIGNQVKDGVENAVRETSSWVIWLGRFGYGAKGFVFIIVGFLALFAAIGTRAANDGTQSALRYIAALPFGQFLLGAVAVGLVGHALWRMVQSLMDTENKGSGPKGIAARGAYAAIALIYLGLAFSAVKIILGERSGSVFWTKSWSAWLLSETVGQWLVGFAGAVTIAIGIYQFYRTYSANFREKLSLAEMSKTEEKWAIRTGRFGYAARGAVFCLIGFFLILAAYQADAGESRGLGGAFRAIEQQPHGAWLLGVVAAGFISYGFFMFVLAKYRRMVIV